MTPPGRYSNGASDSRPGFQGHFISDNTNLEPVFGGMHQGANNHSMSVQQQQQHPADAEAAAASKRWAAMLQNGGFAMISGTPPPDVEPVNNGGPLSRSFTASGTSRSSSGNGRNGMMTEVRSTPDNLYTFAAEANNFRGGSAGMQTIHSTPDNVLDFSSLSSELNSSVSLSTGGMPSTISPSAAADVYGEDAVQTLFPMNGMMNQDSLVLAARLQRMASFQKQQQQQQEQLGLAGFFSGSNGNLSALAAEIAAANSIGNSADGGLMAGQNSSGNLEFNMSYPPPGNKALSSSLYIKVSKGPVEYLQARRLYACIHASSRFYLDRLLRKAAR